MSRLVKYLVSAYVGAGLFGGLVMQAAIPAMNGIGVAVYASSWPAFLYCARHDIGTCDPFSHIPLVVQGYMFTFE